MQGKQVVLEHFVNWSLQVSRYFHRCLFFLPLLWDAGYLVWEGVIKQLNGQANCLGRQSCTLRGRFNKNTLWLLIYIFFQAFHFF